MGCSSGKAIRIHDGTLKASVQVLDEVFDRIQGFSGWVRVCKPRILLNGMQRLVDFFWSMDRNSKKTEDDAGYGAFFVGVAAFSAI